MKRILYIAPHCYPIKSSESICNSKVAHALSEAGYLVDVYTCSNIATYPSDNETNSILSTSENLTIRSVSSVAMRRDMPILKLMHLMLHHLVIFLKTGYFYNSIDTPYQIILSIEKHIKEIGHMPYDVMITRGFCTDVVGIYMKKKYGIKWIANWNDPYPLVKFPAPYGQGPKGRIPANELKVFRDVLENATIHTFPSHRLRKYMLQYYNGVSIDNTRVISHMAYSQLSSKKENRSHKVFKMVHIGDLHRPRSPKYFIQALASAISKRHIPIECHFIGQVDYETSALIRNLDLENIITIHSSITYTESLHWLSQADMSLIIEAICEEGIYLPTKFVDAMQRFTPVFCISPKEGTLHDLVSNMHVGYACDNTNKIEIEDSILRILDDFKNNTLPMITQEKIQKLQEESIINIYKEIL